MMKKTDLYIVFGKQVGWVIVTSLITILIGIFQMPILTKALGTSQYGIWSLISSAISLITPFAHLYFSMSVVRFLASEKDPGKIKEDFISACTLVIVSGTVLSLLLFLLADYFSIAIFKDSSSSFYVRLASILVLLDSLFPVLLAFFRRESKIGIFNILNLALLFTQLGLMILFVTLGYGLRGVIWAAILSMLLMNIFTGLIILKKIGFQLPKFINMKAYLKWGIPLTPNSVITWLINASDRYIISYFLGVSSAGIYSAASGIATYASFALMPVGIVLYPIVSKAYDEKNLEECRSLFKYSMKYLMMISIPAAAGLSILAKPILSILTTPEFVPGNSIVALVAFGSVFNCFSQIGVYIFHLVGKTHLTIRLLSAAAAINIVLNLLLVPQIGIWGSGLAYLITYGLLGTFTYKVTRRYLPYDLSLFFISKCFISAGIMVLAVWLIRPESLAMVLVSTLLGIVIYFGSLVLIKGFTKDEVDFIKSFLRSNLKFKK